ncbi:metallo-beta-lactamase domain-containing protein 2-like, partial [Notothenia coriiceps]
DVINLGDRQLNVLHMPGHSRGSICLHDRDNKMLFSGDVVYDGAMIDWLPYSHVSDYISSCERLVGLVDSEQVDQVLPGHYNTFGAKRLHRIASSYISRAGTCPAKFSTFAWGTLAGVALRAFNPRCAC